MIKQSFAIDEQAELRVDIACNLNIGESDDNQVHVIIEGDEESLKGFEVYQNDDSVVISQDKSGFSGSSQNVVIGNGMSVTQVNGRTYVNNVRTGGNIHIGEVYINGKRVSGGFNSEEFEEVEPIQITVYCPSSSLLDLDINGQATFVSTVHFAHVSLDCSGSVQAAIASVEDLNLDASGSIQIKVGAINGRLTIDASGAAAIDVKGEFEKVVIDVSGSAQINTYGVCQGNYMIDASAVAKVTHYGTVQGRVRKDVSGMARVEV